jgi:hypothetical protein
MRYADILVTDEARQQYEALLSERADLVRDAVDFLIDAWRVLDNKLAHIESPSHTTVLMLCRSEIEFLDGVELLVRAGSAANCFHLLRSAMEAHWGILWILREDTERRGLAYQVGHAHRAIRYAERLDPRTSINVKLRKGLEGQHQVQILEGGDADAAAVAEGMAPVLTHPECVEVEKAWQAAVADRTKKGRLGPPPWYSLFGGPASIRGLAYAVEEGTAYETIYALHSDSVHAGNAFDHLGLPADEGDKAVRPIRHPEGLARVALESVLTATKIVPPILLKYAPESGMPFLKRYERTIRPRILALLDRLRSDPLGP